MTNNVLEVFNSPYTYTRPAPGAYVKGRWANGAAPSPVTFWATIQPLSGRDLLLLPEGERTTETIWIYTAQQLQVAIEQQNQKGDLVSYNGRTWEVQHQENWNLNDFPFFAYRAKLVEQD